MNALFPRLGVAADHDPVGRAEGDRLANRRGPDRDLIAVGPSPIAAPATVGHHVQRVGGQHVGRHDHQTGGLQRIAPADGVERILQVVGAGGDVDAGGAQRPHGGDARGMRDLAIAALQEQVGVGERDHADAGGGDLLGHLALAASDCRTRLTQWLAVTA